MPLLESQSSVVDWIGTDPSSDHYKGSLGRLELAGGPSAYRNDLMTGPAKSP